MQEYRVICKSTRGFINAVLAASHEDTVLEINEPRRELIIPEFEAYRTGLPEIRKILKANVVMLRSQYFNYNDCSYTIKGDINLMSTGTSGNLKKIDTAYQNGAFLRAFVPTKTGEPVFIDNDFKIIFLGPDRTPTLRYKPTYVSVAPIEISVQDFIEVYKGRVEFGTSGLHLKEELEVLYKLLPKLIKYRP